MPPAVNPEMRSLAELIGQGVLMARTFRNRRNDHLQTVPQFPVSTITSLDVQFQARLSFTSKARKWINVLALAVEEECMHVADLEAKSPEQSIAAHYNAQQM